MAADVHDLFRRTREEFDQVRNSFDGGGGGGYDHPMEERVKKLEEFAAEVRTDLRAIDTRLTKIEVKLDTFATTADLHKEMSAQTWRLVTFVCSFGTALVAATYFIAKHTSA
jgi:hypothetical protein